MYKTLDLVMLPTNEKSKLILSFKEKSFNQLVEPKLCLIEESNYRLSNIQSQHLYILSDEPIKEGDWVVVQCSEIKVFEVRKVTGYYNEQFLFDDKSQIHIDYCKKIIATTDNSLETITSKAFKTEDGHYGYTTLKPFEIPQSFVEYFVEEYNKGNIITKVDVEYEEAEEYDKVYGHENKFPRLLINPDFTINIKSTKNSWSREELSGILSMYKQHIFSKTGKETEILPTDKWIEENL